MMEGVIKMKSTKEVVGIIRDWLEKNKIFFETIVMVSLTIMGVVVAWNANKIADKANLLTEKEMNIAHNEKMPNFTMVDDGNSKTYSILNIGGNISDATAVYDYYVCIQADYKNRFEEIIIEVADAYEKTNVSYNYNTCSFENGINDLLIHTMMEEAAELLKCFNVSMEYQIIEVVELAYKDYMDETHIERYILDSPTKNYLEEFRNERYNELRSSNVLYVYGGIDKTEEVIDDSVDDIEIQILLELEVDE